MSLMQSSLNIARKQINNSISSISQSKLDNLIEWLRNYDVSKRVYASVIQRKLDSTLEDTFQIIEILLKNKVIYPQLEIEINDSTLPYIYDSYNEIPEYIYNDEEGLDVLVSSENIFIFYKVSADDTARRY